MNTTKEIKFNHSITKKDDLFNYTIEFNTYLGNGSYGTVYYGVLTDHNNYNRTLHVALKKTKRVDYNETKKVDYNEIKILMHLRKYLGNRKDINYYIDYVYDPYERSLYLITKYIPNQIPLNYILQNKFSVSDIITIMFNICVAIQYVHSLNIAHLDIKPENIMFNYDTLEITIVDFGGSCKILECDNIITTPAFLAPELYKSFANKTELNKQQLLKADIFSLGATFFNCLNGYSIYGNIHNDCKNVTDKLDFYKCCDKKINSNTSFVSTYFDKDINDIINEMINIKLENRPTIDTIVDKLSKILNKYNTNLIKYISFDKELEALLNKKVL